MEENAFMLGMVVGMLIGAACAVLGMMNAKRIEKNLKEIIENGEKHDK